MYAQHLPHGDTLSEDIRFPTTGCVAKANSGKFLLQCLLFQIQAAQSGDFEMAALCLAGKQGRIAFFNPA
jgi:hypothetical protein